MYSHGNYAAPTTPFHLLGPHHTLCQAHSWYMSCWSLSHSLSVCTTTSSLPHLQHHTSTPPWGPCPQCELYSRECQWFWNPCCTVVLTFREPDSEDCMPRISWLCIWTCFYAYHCMAWLLSCVAMVHMLFQCMECYFILDVTPT